MKIYLILTLLALSACSKETIPANNSVTSYAYTYDSKWNLLNKTQSFHWHNVSPEIMNQFINKANDTLCTLSGNTVLTYIIEPDKCQEKIEY